MTNKQKGSKKPSPLRKYNRSNETSYQARARFFYIEAFEDNAGHAIFAIVVTNVEIEGIDKLVSTIMEDEYEFYTIWNDPEIYNDYMVFVQPKWRAGDGLMPWADEQLKKYCSKRIAQLQHEFKSSHISSVGE